MNTIGETATESRAIRRRAATRCVDDGPVKPIIDARDSVERWLIPLQHGPHLRIALVENIEKRLRHVFCSEPCGVWLKPEPHAEYIINLLRTEDIDEHTSIRDEARPTLALELPQSLAHWRAADACIVAHSFFGKVKSRPICAGSDRLADHLIRTLRGCHKLSPTLPL